MGGKQVVGSPTEGFLPGPLAPNFNVELSAYELGFPELIFTPVEILVCLQHLSSELVVETELSPVVL